MFYFRMVFKEIENFFISSFEFFGMNRVDLRVVG